MGRVALEQGDFDDALRRLEKCEAARPKEPRVQFYLGRTLLQLGRAREAVARFDRVLRESPGSVSAIHAKALSLERLGEAEAAQALLEPLITAGTEPASTASLYARLTSQHGPAGAALDYLGGQLDRTDRTPSERQGMLYTLAKICDAAGEYDRAFAAAREANEIDPPPFDPAAFREQIRHQMEVFSAASLPRLSVSSVRSDVPVFIAGLPRSGTTLVEQILDAHPLMHGAGELIHLPQLVGALQMELSSFEPYPMCLEDLTPQRATVLGRAYRSHLQSFSPRARRIIDKTLDNAEHLGLISLLLPGARTIVCQRDPLDTCISCYLNPIVARRFGYVCHLRHLGLAYRQMERLLEHWRQVLPLSMTTVVYEQLVNDPAPVSQRLVQFCGLDWDDRCLKFYASGRAVMTLSFDQVNRPVYRESVGRWKHYEKHLGPLIDALGESAGAFWSRSPRNGPRTQPESPLLPQSGGPCCPCPAAHRRKERGTGKGKARAVIL